MSRFYFQYVVTHENVASFNDDSRRPSYDPAPSRGGGGPSYRAGPRGGNAPSLSVAEAQNFGGGGGNGNGGNGGSPRPRKQIPQPGGCCNTGYDFKNLHRLVEISTGKKGGFEFL